MDTALNSEDNKYKQYFCQTSNHKIYGILLYIDYNLTSIAVKKNNPVNHLFAFQLVH